MEISQSKTKLSTVIIKKCHICGHLNESKSEPKKCCGCNKSFLPLNYFSKVHNHGKEQYDALFEACNELTEQDLIKGIYVIW